jgi:hypothetical protein
MRRNRDIVTASEIADFVYRQEMERLGRPVIEPTQRQRDDGVAFHEELAETERTASASITLGWWIAAAALAALVWWLVR